MRVVIGLPAYLITSAAHAAKYTLADPNGVPSCEVVVLGVKQQLVYGDMFFEQCDPPKPTIGGSGLETRLGGSSDKVWSFSLSGAETTTMYLFDVQNR